jgi:hypothetical protein
MHPVSAGGGTDLLENLAEGHRSIVADEQVQDLDAGGVG